MSTNARLQQIEKISQNARTSWFGLLAILIFVGVTLMGHRDSDFFLFGATTELPLVRISIPTTSFFIAAPMLTASLYVYLHIYLQSLWVALAKCPARIDGEALEECVYPTLLSTVALVARRWLRGESDKPVEGARYTTVAIGLLVVWALAPIMLGALWWRSMPYHSEWLTLWIAFWLWFALFAGASGLFQLCYVMRLGERYIGKSFWSRFAALRLLLHSGVVVIVVGISWDTTEGDYFVGLVPARMIGAELTVKPKNWLHFEIWYEEWEQEFRTRERIPPTQTMNEWPNDAFNQFRHETKQRWTTLTQSLDSPNLEGADLRSADLRRSFWSGANLSNARLEDVPSKLGSTRGFGSRCGSVGGGLPNGNTLGRCGP